MSERGDRKAERVTAEAETTRLEAENRRLRAMLAERETLIDRLQATGRRDAQIRMVADALPVLIAYVDSGERYLYNNKAYQAWAGLEGELFGRTMVDVLGPEAYTTLRPLALQALAGERISTETALNGPDGTPCHIRLDHVPDRQADGKVAGFFALISDISEPKRAETALRESEARFRAMADSAPAPIWVTGPEGIEFVNRAMLDLLGCETEAILHDGWSRFVHPDDADQIWSRRAAAWAGQSVYSFDARFRRADGEWRWLHGDLEARLDPEGNPTGFVGIAMDVTDIKQAEAALRESEALLQAMFANAGVGMVLMDRHFTIVRANAAFADIVGRPPDSLVGAPSLSFGEGDDLTITGEALAAIEGGAQALAFEKSFRRGDGRAAWVRITLSRIGAQLLAIAEDVTARKQIEEALRESEDRLRLANQAAAIGTWDFYPVSGELRWDARCKALFGLPPDAKVDYPLFLAAVHPLDREQASHSVDRALDPSGGGEFDIEYRVVGIADGIERWIAARGRAVFAGARAVRFIGTVLDISERKRAEAELARNQAALEAETRMLETLNRTGAALAGELELRRIVQTITDAGVALSGAEFGAFFYNVLDANGGSYMLYTLSGVERAHFDQFPMPRKTAVFAPTFEGEGVVRSDDITRDPRYGRNAPRKGMPEGHLPVRSYLAVPVVSRSGDVIGGLFFGHSEPAIFSERHESLVVGLAGQGAVAIDNARLFEAAQREIAERSRAQQALSELNLSLEARIAAAIEERERIEEALRQAQKMEAVGQLTGGIAHDFNNLLTVIAGNLDLAQRRLGADGDPRVARMIANARTGAERAATLTQRLLAFSRRQPLAPKRIDVNGLLAGMTDLLHRTIGETIRVETRLAGGLWPVEVDPNQLESAILNLAVNARDAMAEGGMLVIETAPVQVEAGTAEEPDAPVPGAYVVITVVDTGAGMNEDTLRRAVEPFFTTKDVGKGTGLGLSMVYGFVKQSGGHLGIDSAPGQGTRIRIWLPRAAGDAGEAEGQALASAPTGRCDETILVCEDDDDVRAYTTETLAELGYHVLQAADGAATLSLIEDEANRIDLLFTDVVLPGGMSGAELAEAARRARPGLRILFTTGYARDAIVHEGRIDPGVELITKPFAFTELAKRLRDVLDRASA